MTHKTYNKSQAREARRIKSSHVAEQHPLLYHAPSFTFLAPLLRRAFVLGGLRDCEACISCTPRSPAFPTPRSFLYCSGPHQFASFDVDHDISRVPIRDGRVLEVPYLGTLPAAEPAVPATDPLGRDRHARTPLLTPVTKGERRAAGSGSTGRAPPLLLLLQLRLVTPLLGPPRPGCFVG